MPVKSFFGEIEEGARHFYATVLRGEVSDANVRGYLRAASQIEDITFSRGDVEPPSAQHPRYGPGERPGGTPGGHHTIRCRPGQHWGLPICARSHWQYLHRRPGAYAA